MLNTNQSSQQIAKQRVLNISGALNFRDLGGYQTADGRTVQWQRLYRSAQLDRLSVQGVSELVSLGIQTVVDLRFSEESINYPTIQAAIPNAEVFSWHQEKISDSEQRSKNMQSSWRDSLESNDPERVKEAMRLNYPQKLYSHAAIYRTMLMRLAESKTPLLFHCAAGKDRTGVAAALILSLLGVNDEQIIADYLLTQRELEGHIETWLTGGATDSESSRDFQKSLKRYPSNVLKPIFAADETYIKTLLDYIVEKYGSFEYYALQQLNFDQSLIEQLKANLLDG